MIKNITKHIFVTGSSGLVGSHLLLQLVTLKNHKVTALYRSEKPDDKVFENITWIQGDILDVVLLYQIMQSVDEVYHCAALVSFNPKHRESMMKTNVEGTANVVNAALDAGVKKLCYVSSVAALGHLVKGNAISENATPDFTSLDSNYAQSKYMAEAEVWRATGEGLPCVIVNPSIILGSGNWNKGSSQMFKSAYENFPWYAEGTTGFVDVKDAVNAMILLMQSDLNNERFIVSSVNKSYREIFTEMAKGFSKNPPQKKISTFLAGIVWRLEKLKSMFTGSDPLVTKETASSALEKVEYDNSKLLKALPGFAYTPIDETINRVCNQLTERYKL